MDLQQNDKTAFISGSTQGIGFAMAKPLLNEGELLSLKAGLKAFL